ncbi:MAG: PQQ-binding-like beta-propeller repeat protein [Zavarzinella sp.]
MPAKLPEKLSIIWSVPTSAPGLGGVAATDQYVLFSDRELNDTTDVLHCLEIETGKIVWSYRNPAIGLLDYGSSSRATPLIVDDKVYFHNAYGWLACLELPTGKTVWEMDTRAEFMATDERKWGTCSSPLIVDNKLIINPGGKEASIVALNPKSGKVIWKTPGRPASYGSLNAAKIGPTLQIVGMDETSLCGWDVATGKLLWELRPETASKFNVSTPIIRNQQLILALENNGTSVFQFDKNGKIISKPIGWHRDLSPESHTPVLAGARLFGIWHRLYCLDLNNKLNEVYDSDDPAFSDYGATVATDERVLIITGKAELILLDPKADKFQPISRVKIVEDEKGLYSHPAFVGTRMYVRTSTQMMAIELQE